jgi:hypothetical protein
MPQQAGNLQAGVGRLKEAWDVLSVRWLETREHWHDANARRFEAQELQLLAEELQRALPAISHMAQVIVSAERELSDDRR